MEKGKHGYSGMCAPGNQFQTHNTFSVGIFQWVQKKSRNGLKKSAVKVRVTGYVSNPKPVYEKAIEIASAMDAGTYTGPKNLRVK